VGWIGDGGEGGVADRRDSYCMLMPIPSAGRSIAESYALAAHRARQELVNFDLSQRYECFSVSGRRH
jgi:hypothetical protein